MRAVDIIARKRDGQPLSDDEISFFVDGFTRGTIPDYQVAAWLMAILLRGMEHHETVALTMAIVHSGKQLDLHDVAPFVADKHSTGGVGDKTTLVVGPLVAAAGVRVGKMSGRGLGFTGGTLDKLESIPGYRADLGTDEFRHQLASVGLVVTGQSVDLAPADGKLYALRDVTATVQSPPLIASSIMGKKIASGADGIVLDVKVGNGAFMKTEQEAADLARLLVDIGRGVGRKVRAVISDMSQPLGDAVGNALELKEAIDTLHGAGPSDFRQHCLTVATQVLLLERQEAAETITPELERLLDGGMAWEKFRQWIGAQGGDLGYVDEPGRLPSSRLTAPVLASRSGYVSGVRADVVGLASMQLGGGRAEKDDAIDHSVGVVLSAKVTDWIEEGQPLLTIHANSEARLQEAAARLAAAYVWSDTPVKPPRLTHQIMF
ncbi:MAG TPA: thymidine phosphorylase [Anaerolineae bacterium]|nr:thymidine phosphorylase [Anaerolineae bacterium]